MELHRLSDAVLVGRGVDRWGNWRYDHKLMALRYHDPRGYIRYEIDLEATWDAAECLDWIVQIAGKQWAEAPSTAVIDLIDALNALSGTIQGAMCPFGQNREFDFAEHLRGERGPGGIGKKAPRSK